MAYRKCYVMNNTMKSKKKRYKKVIRKNIQGADVKIYERKKKFKIHCER